jgi:dephospho-CoA kinase
MEKDMIKKKKLILGLMGKPGCGKDTVADIIRQWAHDQTVMNMRFSDILKDTCEI